MMADIEPYQLRHWANQIIEDYPDDDHIAFFARRFSMAAAEIEKLLTVLNAARIVVKMGPNIKTQNMLAVMHKLEADIDAYDQSSPNLNKDKT